MYPFYPIIGVTLIVMGESAQVQFNSPGGLVSLVLNSENLNMFWGCFKDVSDVTEQYTNGFSNIVHWRHISGSGINFVFTISLAYK